jgi:hypothetical protein
VEGKYSSKPANRFYLMAKFARMFILP